MDYIISEMYDGHHLTVYLRMLKAFCQVLAPDMEKLNLHL